LKFYFPEIDDIIHIKGATEKGFFVEVKISEANEYELIRDLV
jgi:hypothetical protein